jgi:hypothetical protein
MPTYRLVAKDITVWKYGTLDVLATYTEGELRLEIDHIDTTALQDVWKHPELGQRGWSITCTKLIEAALGFIDLFLNPTEVLVQFAVTFPGTTPTTVTLSGTAIPRTHGIRVANPMTENAEFVGVGALTKT